MTPVLVDSNVILDVATEDEEWSEWSSATLARVAAHAVLVVNPIIYAEVSVGYARIEDLEAALPSPLFAEIHFPGRRHSWRGRRFSLTGGAEADEGRRCRTSTSARTPRSPASAC